MFTVTTTQRTLVALTLAMSLAACEDNVAPTPKKKPVATVETPQTIATPTPAPEVTPSPTPGPTAKIDSGIKKADTIVEEDSDADKPGTALAAARKALATGDYERGLKLAKIAVDHAPKRSGAWNTLGRAQLQAGKRKAALESFQKAVELNPGNSYAQNNLGRTLIYEGRYEEAIDALEEATQLEPVEGYMWNNLGMAYEHTDKLDEARDAYAKAVEMDNDRAQDSLARLEGVKTVVRTAKVDPSALEKVTPEPVKEEVPAPTTETK